jgi:hypothetical protein
MDNFLAACFLIFGLGFFAIGMRWVDSMQVRDQERLDHRRDLEYTRLLNERREFGYDRVEEAITSRPIFRSYKTK